MAKTSKQLAEEVIHSGQPPEGITLDGDFEKLEAWLDEQESVQKGYASVLKAPMSQKDTTPFGNFMHDFMTSAKNKKKFSAPKQLIAVALNIAERKDLHYVPVSQRKEEK